MCESRVLYAKSGELELRLETLPPLVSSEADDSPVDAREAERRSLELLLHSSGADVSRILDMQDHARRQ
jgi:hypothetical protein